MDRYDISINVQNNDISWVVSDEDHVEDTINAFPGWWKEHPGDGVGIRDYLNSTGQEQVIKRSMMINLTADGYTVTNPQVIFGTDGTLYINPNATI